MASYPESKLYPLYLDRYGSREEEDSQLTAMDESQKTNHHIEGSSSNIAFAKRRRRRRTKSESFCLFFFLSLEEIPHEAYWVVSVLSLQDLSLANRTIQYRSCHHQQLVVALGRPRWSFIIILRYMLNINTVETSKEYVHMQWKDMWLLQKHKHYSNYN